MSLTMEETFVVTWVGAILVGMIVGLIIAYFSKKDDSDA